MKKGCGGQNSGWHTNQKTRSPPLAGVRNIRHRKRSARSPAERIKIKTDRYNRRSYRAIARSTLRLGQPLPEVSVGQLYREYLAIIVARTIGRPARLSTLVNFPKFGHSSGSVPQLLRRACNFNLWLAICTSTVAMPIAIHFPGVSRPSRTNTRPWLP
jgi:hypothetical protein